MAPLAASAAMPLAAQLPGRQYRIGVLRFAADTTLIDAGVWHAFVRRLGELGYRDGINLVIEQRLSDIDLANNVPLVQEMVRLRADVVVVSSGAQARSVMSLNPAMPIVATFLPADPVRAGLVASLARPGGQLTGVSDLSDELVPKRLELLKAAVPSAKRVAYVRCPKCALGAGLTRTEFTAQFAEQEAAARALGMTLVPADLNDPALFDGTATIVRRERADALLIGTNRFNVELREKWLAFAAQHRLPSLASYRGFGAMLSYGPQVAAIYNQAAELVAKILGGARPGELPMQQPTRFEFIVNLKMAKAMGLTIPQSVLLRATEVIE